MDESFLEHEPTKISDPVSLKNSHDYPYFAVLKNGRVVAYAGCLVAGDMLLLATMYGHALHHSNAVVPLLITGIAEYTYSHSPKVKYYVYDTYYGARKDMRRFKKKFGFKPCVVNWIF